MYNLSGPTRLRCIFLNQDTDLTTCLRHECEINNSNEIAWKTSALIINEWVHRLKVTN